MQVNSHISCLTMFYRWSIDVLTLLCLVKLENIYSSLSISIVHL